VQLAFGNFMFVFVEKILLTFSYPPACLPLTLITVKVDWTLVKAETLKFWVLAAWWCHGATLKLINRLFQTRNVFAAACRLPDAFAKKIAVTSCARLKKPAWNRYTLK